MFFKTLKKGELQDIDVSYVSLLFDGMTPANQKGFVVKSADGISFQPIFSSEKFKSETVGNQGRLYVTVLEPDTKDAQGDYYSKDEIQKACDKFAQKGNLGRNDVNHNMHPVNDFYVAENYILKSDDKTHFPDTKIGAWVQVIKCNDLDSELWQKVKKNSFRGVSIYGKAKDMDEAQTQLKSIESKLADLTKQKELLEKSTGERVDNVLQELNKQIEIAKNNLNTEQVNNTVKAIAKSVEGLTTALQKGISKSIKDDDHEKELTEIDVAGTKVTVKSSHKELYKGISEVDSGKAMSILNANTTGLFIDEVIGGKEDGTLKDITVVPLLKDEKIDIGLIDDLIFKNSSDGAVTAQNVATADISCPTSVLNAEFNLGRDTVEFYKDKYGEDAFGAYVEQHLVKKVSKAMRMLLFKGDRTSAVDKLKALNGVIKQATSNSDVTAITRETYETWPDVFEKLLLGFSDEMLEEQENFKFYVSFKTLIGIRTELSKRQTVVGDRLLLEGGKLSFAGIPIEARLIPDNNVICGLPKFIILGYRTDAELKVEHHGADWKYHWYIRLRSGITYIQNFVKVFNITVATPTAPTQG